ncbi:LppM family (lipo)protein [Stomatohabitans albus]|uniref:LppM family (lipo)protein n=1 Tax=Stomatohabitans albus TaxID=3110766 RepID=UPI00300CBAF7
MFQRLLPLLFVLVLTGCVRQHVDMTVHPDGSQIDIDMIAAADTEWAAKQGIDLDAKTQEQQVDASSFGPEARFEQWADGKWVGQHLIAPNTPIENVLNGGLLSYERQGETITFSTSPRQLGWGAESSNFDEVVNSEADLRLRVHVPGSVQETNGQLDGEWVVWTTRDANLEAFTLTAVADDSAELAQSSGAPKPTPTAAPAVQTDSGIPLWVWIGIAVVSIGAGWFVWTKLGAKP